jgi:hypothetical protein
MDGNNPLTQVIAVRKNRDGDIVQLQLSSGEVMDYKTAQQMAKSNRMDSVNVDGGRDGEAHLRSAPDGREENNLE